LYVSVYSPVQNLRIIDDLPTPPFPTTIIFMVAADCRRCAGKCVRACV
jgi:hypothetical protein